jgi:REP element-mobilizing transposase RayT
MDLRRRFWEIEAPRNRKLTPALYAESGQSCFLTVRAAQGRKPFDDEKYAHLAVHCLLAQRSKLLCQIEVYCFMPDHVHLVATPMIDGASTLTFVDRFKGWCGREMRLAGWQGEVWQRRNYDHLLRAEEDLGEIAAYILGNPVRKGLCVSADDYPWSGIPTPQALAGM